MKNTFLKLSLFSVAFLLFACSDTDKLIDDVFDNTTSGVILRTLETETDIEFNDDSVVLSYLLEVQDEEDGNLTDRVLVYASFTDNTNEIPNNRDEVLIATINSSSFITGERLPRVSFEIGILELESALGMTRDDYTGGDVFPVRFEAITTDGRRFSNDNASQSVLGNSFLLSPFVYDSNVVCPFGGQSLAGTHTFVTTDMFIPGANPCGGTVSGSVVWGETNAEGSYTTSDFSFGLFESSCWNDSPATSSTARVVWFCSNLNTAGTDQYGESWAYTIVSVNGPTMVIEFLSTFNTGEGGVTTLTREGGQDWPAIFQD
ncbi:MAG: hypothetical protein WDZ45_04935 [Flavobacteriaceae bacterium]